MASQVTQRHRHIPLDHQHREVKNLPVVSAVSDVVSVPKNSVAGTAESLTGSLANQGVGLSKVQSLLIQNGSGAGTGSLYIRTDKLGASKSSEGIELAAGGSLHIGWHQDSRNYLLVENAKPFHVWVFS